MMEVSESAIGIPQSREPIDVLLGKLGNLNASESDKVHKKIVDRIGKETDFGKEIGDILPVDTYFNPHPDIKSVAIPTIQSGGKAEVSIVHISKMKHLLSTVFDKNKKNEGGWIDPETNTIYRNPTDNDSIPKLWEEMLEGWNSTGGRTLAHEITHAIQIHNTELPINSKNLSSRETDVRNRINELRENDPSLTPEQAVAAIITMSDRTIIREMQAYFVSESLIFPNKLAINLKKMIKEYREKTDGQNKNPVVEQLIAKSTSVNSSLNPDLFDEEGYPHMEESLEDTLDAYIHPELKKRPETAKKIHAAYRQITVLKELGMNNTQIALLINQLDPQLVSGLDFDHSTNQWTSLTECINHLKTKNNVQETDDELIARSEAKRKARSLQVQEIMTQEILNKDN